MLFDLADLADAIADRVHRKGLLQSGLLQRLQHTAMKVHIRDLLQMVDNNQPLLSCLVVQALVSFGSG